jgi:hypothetical protein
MTGPTLYPDINALLGTLLGDVREMLGTQFAGLYLYGSVASGDFNPETSDIDVVIVTEDEIADGTVPELEAMHTRITESGNPWARTLEGSYIPRHALQRYNPADPPRPSFNDGRFYLARHSTDWILQRHILREHGVVLTGPPPATLIDPVTPDGLRRAVSGLLHEWWSPMLDQPTRLHDRTYQAYAVLTMCRALYTLHHSAIASKPAAARWARSSLDSPWPTLIDQALAWPHGPQPNELDATIALIRHTLARSQNTEPSRNNE